MKLSGNESKMNWQYRNTTTITLKYLSALCKIGEPKQNQREEKMNNKKNRDTE